MAREQVWKQPHHDLAVFQHVGHARRRARIVFQHVEIVGVDPHHVDAGDVHIDIVRHVELIHLRAEHRILEDQIFRNAAGAQDLALMINVAQKQIERADPLLQSGFEPRPFLAGQDARDHVEWDQPLLGGGVAIDRESDADSAKQQLCLVSPVFQSVRRRFA